MSAFDALSPELQAALARLAITEPTQVQQSALPPALKGRDILATAQTGTGKTFAFLLPLITHLRAQAEKAALILSPTRELAQQTQAALVSVLPQEPDILSALIIGGENIHKQYALLRRKPRVIIGTPGRIIDHILHKSITLKNIAYLVLDEADRMLDMGFIPDVRKICAALPAPRQTLLFSATLPPEIEQLAAGLLQDPVRVQIGSVSRPVDLVVQQMIRLGTRERLGQLLLELQARPGQMILVFVKSKHGADRLAKQLKQYGVKANALHGDLRQNRRRQVMEMFRAGTVPVLVATDVAARGLDVDGMSCVINYDLPQCPEDYIHRIGRTGRAGSVGTALSFILEEDDTKWKDICRACRLGKVTELTKSSRSLPKPKFVPEDHRKKPTRPQVNRNAPGLSSAAVCDTYAGVAAPIKKAVARPVAHTPKKVVMPTAKKLTEKSMPQNGFHIVRVGKKKKQSTQTEQKFSAPSHKHRRFVFKKHKHHK